MFKRIGFLAVLFYGALTLTAQADLFSVQVVTPTGSDGGVSFSWLHNGGTNGSGVANKWKVEGDILVDYSATGGDDANGELLELVTGGGNTNTLDIFDGAVHIGTVEITGLRMWDPGDLDGNQLGWMDVEITSDGNSAALDAIVATESSPRIDFRDRNYGSASNGFNGFGLSDDALAIRLWGDENQFADASDSSVNWGMDWASTGVTVIPAPGAALLGVIGMGCVSLVRRRR